jgi:hypothetical protein
MKKAITLFALVALFTVSASVNTTKINVKANVTADSDTGGRATGDSKPDLGL